MRALRIGIALGAALLAGVGSAGAQQVHKVGTGVAPFGFVDPKTNAIQGYAVEVMNAVAKEGGLQVQFIAFASFGEILPALLSKQIDIDASPTTITPERKAMGAEFSEVYAMWTEGLVVAKNDPKPYKSVDELRGEAVAAAVGTIYLDGLKAKSIFKEVRSFSTTDDAVQLLNKGEVKAFLTNAATMPFLQKQGQYPDVKMVSSYTPIYNSAGAIAVRKGETELLAKINTALAKLKADGTINMIATRWGVVPPN